MNEGNNELPKKNVRIYTNTDINVIKCLLYLNKPMTAYEIASNKERGIGIRERSGEVKESCEILTEDGILRYEKETNKYSLNKSNKVIDFLFCTIGLSSKGDVEMIDRVLDNMMRTIFLTKEGKTKSTMLLEDAIDLSDGMKADFPPDEKNIAKLQEWIKKYNSIRNPRW